MSSEPIRPYIPLDSLAMPVGVVCEVIHEAVRVIQKHNNEEVSPPWDEAPDWMRNSTLSGVTGVLNGNTPRESHNNWMETRKADGWVYGEVKDIEKKISPALVPYGQLPEEQKVKDHLFYNIVHSFVR